MHTIALRQMLPPDRYAEFRRDAERLMARQELVPSYAVVLGQKPG